MRESLEKLQRLIKRHGFSGLILYLFRLIFLSGNHGKTGRMFLYILETPRPAPDSIHAAEGHTFRFAALKELEEWRRNPSCNLHQADIEAFNKGDRCLLQLDSEKLVGYAWLASSSLVEIMQGFHFNMPDDTVYNYKAYTAPEYRGKGFQPLRHLKLLEHVRQNGQHRLFGYVDQLNLNSQKGVRKSGYMKIGVLRCLSKGNTKRFFLKVDKDFWGTNRRT